MPAPVALPPQFGRYRIVERLGAGGMGAVYLAEDTLLSRQVAVKVPHFTADESPVAIQRFLREARAAAALNHPNLCPVFDAGEVDGTHYLVMPFIEGTPLSKLIHEGQPWEPEKALALVQKLAAVLQVLHEHGLIHRDLKPSNVMIRAGGEPIIMDFGLARSTEQETQQITHLGSLVGTPAFMAPEQVQGDLKALGPATDVYSLGVLLYQLLTGHLPFEGPPLAVYDQVLHAVPQTPSALCKSLEPWLDRVCMKALAKKPAERYLSMKEFASALEPLAPVWPVPARSDPARRVATPRPEPQERQQQQVEKTPRPEPPASPKEPPPRKPSPPGQSITCPQCGRKLRIPPGAGADLSCPRCGADLPPGDSALQETPSPSAQGSFTEADSPVQGTSAGKWFVALCLLAAAALGSWFLFGPQPKNRKEITNSIGMKFVQIPAGKFLMGSPKEEENRDRDEAQHEVEITKPFYLGIHEVTQGQYEQVMAINPSYFSASRDGKEIVKGKDTSQFPVDSVSWEEARKFCVKLSELPDEKLAGRSYRLPTEAEWEYACRGGASTYKPVHFGDSLSSNQANFHGSYPYGRAPTAGNLQRPCEVGSYPANAFGLCDMHGNVWEWCQDWYGPYPANTSIVRDPTGPKTGTERILRGGSWYSPGSSCRSANRDKNRPGHRDRYIGFRVVCVVGTP
jgi:formylglycine-generating enzyme required for sulfatase activity